MKKIAISCCAALLLSGCGNMSYLMETYGDKPHENLMTQHGEFWIWDRPALGKIMTSPNLSAAAGIGLASGATLGLAKVDPVVQLHQDVVRQWFAKDGRRCEIKTSVEIMRPEYEHTYTCASATPRQPKA